MYNYKIKARMKKIEDIKTPTNVKEFRDNLKKYCLGHNDNIFIYRKKNNTKYSINVNKIFKISDILKFLKSYIKFDNVFRDYNIVLMCDISHINNEDIMLNKKNAINKLKEVYLFNNQDNEERNNFLKSTPSAIAKIVSGEKIYNEIDSKPIQTALGCQKLTGLYIHLFGAFFDTVIGYKKIYNLSKYN